MGRRPCCSKEGLNRGAWSVREDKILTNYIAAHGEGKWRDLPKNAGLKRCGKSCRLRWLNYLRPDIKRGNISKDEADLIIRLHKLLGNRWSLIAGRLPGRTDNEIKNYWNTNLSKRMSANSSPTTKPKERKGRTRRPSAKSPSMASAARQGHDVVRLKAVRCTGVYLPKRHHQDLLVQENAVGIGNTCTSSSTPLGSDVVDDPMDLFMGLNMEKIMSEIQESEILEECVNHIDDQDRGNGAIHGGKMDGNVSGSDSTFLFEDAVVENWQDLLGPDADTDLKDLASFLDSDMEW